MNDPCLSVLLLTEDSAGDAHATLRALTVKMAQLVVPGCRSHRIDLQPQPERVARAMHGNAWKGRAHFARVDLAQTIATKLMEDRVPGFVFVHFDGDRRWSQRKACENKKKFQDFVRHHVEPIVEGVLTMRGSMADKPARMTRLRTLVPFYSIEAWLYQNTEQAVRICRESGCGRHLEVFAAWEKKRAALDQIEKPKREEVSCLRDANNRRLAEHDFPADEVFSAGCSFTAAVAGLRECEALREALLRTLS